MLEIKNLHVKLENEDRTILNGLTLVREGRRSARHHGAERLRQIDAVLCPVRPRRLCGHRKARSPIRARTSWRCEPDERAAKGVFLAFQYPIEIPGVATMQFLKVALNAQRKARGEKELSTPDFMRLVKARAAELGMSQDMLKRAVNVGFSGGEKKRAEILQMAVLEPNLCILDETDSGLDIDALRIVADGVNALRSPDRAMIVITHYQRLLDYIVPDFVHVLSQGRIVKSGGKNLALELEEKGYAEFEKDAA